MEDVHVHCWGRIESYIYIICIIYIFVYIFYQCEGQQAMFEWIWHGACSMDDVYIFGVALYSFGWAGMFAHIYVHVSIIHVWTFHCTFVFVYKKRHVSAIDELLHHCRSIRNVCSVQHRKMYLVYVHVCIRSMEAMVRRMRGSTSNNILLFEWQNEMRKRWREPKDEKKNKTAAPFKDKQNC